MVIHGGIQVIIILVTTIAGTGLIIMITTDGILPTIQVTGMDITEATGMVIMTHTTTVDTIITITILMYIITTHMMEQIITMDTEAGLLPMVVQEASAAEQDSHL